jgi:fucose 4-O-acetylase-like acetyltransferase
MTDLGGAKSKISKVRDERIDALKFWLIVLVIAAHVFMRKEFAESSDCAVLWNWISIFVMPLFVFISGYYSRKKDNKDFLLSIWKLVEPLIIFHVIGLLFYVKHPLSVRIFLTPWYVLWYLLSLIYWRLMLQIIPDNVLRHTKLILISTFCISILAGFLPFDRILSLQRTLSLMPFFFLGYYMKGKNIYLPDKYKLMCIVLLLVVLVFLLFFPWRMNFLKYAFPYGNIYGAAIRIIAFAVAIMMSIAFMNVCYNTPWAARQGKMSMQYYILHALIISPFMALVVKLNIPMTFITAIIIIIGIALGISVMS